MKLVYEYEQIHCTLMMAKVRITPKRFVSISRLELFAAFLAVKISALIKKDLVVGNLKEYFWTDNRFVLGYIANDFRGFKIFVANRVQPSHEYSSANQWSYIPSEDNLVDYSPRGMTIKYFQHH